LVGALKIHRPIRETSAKHRQKFTFADANLRPRFCVMDTIAATHYAVRIDLCK
jgi:hypothetical protein